MFKSSLVCLSFLFFSTMIQAEALNQQPIDEGTKVNVVAQRLASKTINEILEITMKLQLECQRQADTDTCSGVKTMLAVLDLRLTESSKTLNTKSVAFLKGVISGVQQANNSSLVKLSDTN